MILKKKKQDLLNLIHSLFTFHFAIFFFIFAFIIIYHTPFIIINSFLAFSFLIFLVLPLIRTGSLETVARDCLLRLHLRGGRRVAFS